ncbi:MAG: twin-arginine translocase TatA/TatE family subunit [Pirellulales bacterium]
MFGLNHFELMIVGIVAVLLFGNRLPSVARSMGKSLTEFKKGISGLDTEVRDAFYSEPNERVSYERHTAPSSPAFEPPVAQPATVGSASATAAD